MRTIFITLSLLFVSFISISQIQIGQDLNGLDGEELRRVDISSNGNIIAVGMPHAQNGKVRIFKEINQEWVQIGNDIDGEGGLDHLGSSLSLSSNGNVIAISSPFNDDNGFNAGKVQVFELVNDTWVQKGQDLIGNNENYLFGTVCALSGDSSTVAIRSEDSDNAGVNIIKVFEFNNNDWAQVGVDIQALESVLPNFNSISLSENGSILAIGSPDIEGQPIFGRVDTYKRMGDSFEFIEQIFGTGFNDYFGRSLDLSSSGDYLVIGASNALTDSGGFDGISRVYKLDNDNWTQVGEDIFGDTSSSDFGYGVSISSNGERILCIGGITGEGIGDYIRIYDLVDNSWIHTATVELDEGPEFYGSGLRGNLSSNGLRFIVGEQHANQVNNNFLGRVRVYELNNDCNNPPTVSIDPIDDSCNTSDIQFNASLGGSAASVTWTTTGSGSFDNSNSLTPTYTPSNNDVGTTITFTATTDDPDGQDGPCEAATASVTIDILTEVTSAFTITSQYCLGDTADALPNTSSNGIIGTWSPTSIDTSTVGSNNYLFTPDSEECASEYTVSVTINDCNNDCLLEGFTQIGDDLDGEAAGDFFGESISISANGNIIAIGGSYNSGNGTNSGHVRVFENVNNNWIQIGQDIDGENAIDYSGRSISLSADGNRLAVGAPYNDGSFTDDARVGHVRVYEYQNGSWNQIGQDIDGDQLLGYSGHEVTLAGNGMVVAIGAIQHDGNGTDSGQVKIFEYQNNTWIQVGQDLYGEESGDSFGRSLSLSETGTRIVIGAVRSDSNGNNSGEAKVYENNSGNWELLGNKILSESSGDEFGESVAISWDGQIVAVSARYNEGELGPNARPGSTRVFQLIDNNWVQIGQDIDGEAGDDFSGDAIALSANGQRLVIGAPANDGNGNNSGHVRVYEYISGIWELVSLDIDGEYPEDQSGISVDLSANGDIIAIGAFSNDDNGNSSGHARVFSLSVNCSEQPVISIDDVVDVCGTDSVPLTAIIEGCFHSVTWTTTGSGSFDDVNSLTPTYTPSSNEVGTMITFTATTDDPDGNGSCVEAVASITVDVLDCSCTNSPTVSIDPIDDSCSTSDIQFNASLGGSASSITWSSTGNGSFDNSNSFTPTYTPSANDVGTTITFNATTDDPDGQDGPCVAASASVSIDILIEATPTFSITSEYCLGNTADALPNTSTNGVTGTWSPATIDTSTVGTSNYVFTPNSDECASAYTLSVTINDCTCTNPPTVSIDPIDDSCNTNDIQFNSSIEGSATSVTWSTTGSGSFDNSNSLTPTYTPSNNDVGTTITFTANTDDPDGQDGPCVAATDSVSIDILIEATPTFTITSQYCLGDTAETLPNTSSNGISGSWSPATIDTSTVGTSNYVFTPNSNVCTSAYILSVTINDCNCANPPTVSIDPIDDSCSTSDIQFNASIGGSATSVTWSSTGNGSFDNSNSFTPTYTPSANDVGTTITFNATTDDPDGQDGPCVAASASVSIDILIEATPTFTITSQYCLGDTAETLPNTSTNGVTGTWSPATIDTSTAGTNTYVFTPISDECASEYLKTIMVDACECVVEVYNTIEICQGEELFFSGDLVDTSHRGSFTHEELLPNSLSCDELQITEIMVMGPEFPSSFSPRKMDGINDEFKVLGVERCDITEYQLTIFNRWGEIVFNSNNPLEGWDGKISSSPEEQFGIFLWDAEYTINGIQLNQKGTVIIQ